MPFSMSYGAGHVIAEKRRVLIQVLSIINKTAEIADSNERTSHQHGSVQTFKTIKVTCLDCLEK